MATDRPRSNEDEDGILASKRAMWSGFTKFSTYSIVTVAAVLILMALFLL